MSVGNKGPLYYASVLFALIILGLAGYFIYLLVGSSDQARLAVLTAAVSIGTLVYTQTKNTKREVEGRQFAKKAEAYEEVMAIISNVMKAVRDEQSPDPSALAERMSDIVPRLLIWAGPEVLNAWQNLTEPSDDPMAALRAGNNLIAALRKELGHSTDQGLGPYGLVATFVRGDERHKLVSPE